MGTSRFGQTDTAKLVAKNKQVLGETPDDFRFVGFDLGRKTDRQPVSPQSFTSRCAPADAGHYVVFFLVHRGFSGCEIQFMQGAFDDASHCRNRNGWHRLPSAQTGNQKMLSALT